MKQYLQFTPKNQLKVSRLGAKCHFSTITHNYWNEYNKTDLVWWWWTPGWFCNKTRLIFAHASKNLFNPFKIVERKFHIRVSISLSKRLLFKSIQQSLNGVWFSFEKVHPVFPSLQNFRGKDSSIMDQVKNLHLEAT